MDANSKCRYVYILSVTKTISTMIIIVLYLASYISPGLGYKTKQITSDYNYRATIYTGGSPDLRTCGASIHTNPRDCNFLK
jgi:hypothetical protein